MELRMKVFRNLWLGLLALVASVIVSGVPAHAQQKPNIVFIMGDDIGWFNVGAYHRGMMSGQTPNLDRLAAQGMMFTDYYAEASCTAGRANFITGELPIRTGMTTVGQAGADVGLPAEASTIATALKSMGYATGQFGKNHLGDLNKFLPTVHGFDEFFGYLYHLDAMSDPFWYSYPTDPAIRNPSVASDRMRPRGWQGADQATGTVDCRPFRRCRGGSQRLFWGYGSRAMVDKIEPKNQVTPGLRPGKLYRNTTKLAEFNGLRHVRPTVPQPDRRPDPGRPASRSTPPPPAGS
jgi:hypothetical protein